MNPFGRSAQEQRAFEQAFYPGTQTLINKRGYRDPIALDGFERKAVVERLSDGLPDAAREMSPAGVQAIHKHLLQDVYEWAGTYRQYTTGRGSAPFARPEFIAPEMSRLFERLDDDRYLKGTTPEAFAAKAAAHVNDLNAIHPFIDGNGRTQRIWLRGLAVEAGYDLALQRGDGAAWNAASKAGFYTSNDPMAALIAARLEPLREQARTPLSPREQALMDRYRVEMDRSAEARAAMRDRTQDRDDGQER